MKRCAVVILNWNGKKMLEAYLPAVLAHSQGQDIAVVVADNASSDDSVAFMQAQYPEVELLLLEKNYGYAAGYNKALETIKASYYLLLNSDVETTPGYLDTLIKAMDEDPQLWACMPKLKDLSHKNKFEYAGACGGFIDFLGYPFCRGRIFDQLEEDRGQYDDRQEVMWASGAAMMVRADKFHELGGFDPDFFAHMEEVDLCWRMKSRGGKVAVVPSSIAYHLGGGTLNSSSPFKTYLNFRNNLLTLYKNLPTKSLVKVFFLRFFLDQLAALVFLLKGEAGNAWAVLRAQGYFWFKKKQVFRQRRKDNLRKSVISHQAILYSRSILWAFHVKGKKKYSDLPQDS